MKIDNSGKSLSGPTAPRTGNIRPGAQQGSVNGTNDAGKAKNDSVELSSNSLKLSAMEGTLASQPVVDSARVNEIRQAIAEGKFKINPDAIADKLVASVKELLANRKD
jgi:negative regulator of flagellin synthesis FlgM